jgi:hypothetical protein
MFVVPALPWSVAVPLVSQLVCDVPACLGVVRVNCRVLASELTT